ncbi:MAG: hypothetical protein BZ136_09245 [Methanosphaera sp. rholeuAM74]|nr:MAG: hypothetical protein BZ136_09245 [Methanosphaera sp. rholeuAM74]
MFRVVETPTPEHLKLIDNHDHISWTGRYYIIRKTVDKNTYYYGSYTDYDEALIVNERLQQRGYPPTIIIYIS